MSAPTVLTSGAAYDRNPAFLKAADGTYWLFFARSEASPCVRPTCNADTATYNIFYMTSTNGTNWSLPMQLSDRVGLSPTFYGRTVAATQDSTGKIWVFWTSGGNSGPLYYYTIVDGLPSGRQELNDAQYFNAEAITGVDGKVWLFYQDGALDGIYARSYDGSWSSPTLVASGYSIPKVIDDGGTFRLVMVNGDGSIYLTTSTDGITWTPPQLIIAASGGVMNWDPAIFKDASGKYNLFYAPDLGTGAQRIEWAQSNDGVTWPSSGKRVTAGSWRSNTWWDYWPEAGLVGSDLYLFYTSEKNGATLGSGHITAFKVDWDPSVDHFEAIQPAIDAAAEGDAVNVAPGDYAEQLTIEKSLSLTGAGMGMSTIKAPSTLADGAVSGQKSIVEIGNGATVNASGLTIAGPGPTGCNSLNNGVFVGGNAVFNISNSSVVDIRDNPFSGCQNGNAIRFGGELLGNQVGTGSVNNVLITNFQKTGIVVDGPGSFATVTNSTITGVGNTPRIAQNGIQVSRGASANVNNNQISNLLCDHPSCGMTGSQSAGLLVWDRAGGTYTNNTLTNIDAPIFDSNTTATYTANTVSLARYIGIWTDSGTPTISRNTISGLITQTIGVYAYSDDGTDTVASTGGIFANNVVSNTATALVVEDASPGGAQSLTFSATNNHLGGNTVGADVRSTTLQATDNWWGGTAGPKVASHTYNVSAQGIPIVTNATGVAKVVPFLNDGTDADPGQPGFDPLPGASFSPVTVSAPADSFGSIQAAVNSADAGATITVRAGKFSEKVTVNKALTFEGAQAGVDARSRTGSPSSESIVLDSFYVTTGDVTIDGFTVQDADGVGDFGQGIYLSDSGSGYQILNNIIQNNIFGIYLNSNGATQSVVRHNAFINNNRPGSASGDAIYSDRPAANLLIEQNRFTGHRSAAMVLAGTHSNVVFQDNELVDDRSIVFFNTTDAVVRNNTSTRWSGSGVYLGGGNDRVTIDGNTFTDGNSRPIMSTDGGVPTPNSNITVTNNTITIDAARLGGSLGLIDLRHFSADAVVAGNGITVTGVLTPGWFVHGVDVQGATAGNVRITGNTLNGGGIDTYDGSSDSAGILLRSSLPSTAEVNISGNTITGWVHGIAAEALPTGASVSANNNAIVGNSYLGVSNGAGAGIDAARNWWGTPYGPHHATSNPSGTGNGVSDNVTFKPWYLDAARTQLNDVAPPTPTVSTPPAVTRASSVTLTVTSANLTTIKVVGGSDVVTKTSTGSAVDLTIPLNLNATNVLSVTAAYPGGPDSTAVVRTVVQDSNPPAPPTVAPVSSPTRATSITLTVTAEAGTTIKVTGGAEDATATATGSPQSVPVRLKLNTTNTLSVTATDEAGNTSSPTIVTVVQDSTPPSAPIVSTPKSPTNATSVTLDVTAEAGTTIRIVGGASPITATATGAVQSFTVGLRPNTANSLTVTAVNAAGNESPAVVRVVVQDSIPPQAPIVSSPVTITNRSNVTLSVVAEPGSTIKVAGGAEPVSAIAGQSATSVVVPLNVDAVNALSVTATDAAGNTSNATSVSVRQKSTPPTLTVSEPTSPTSETSVILQITTEADALIKVTGGWEPVTALGTGGQQDVAVPLIPNDLNRLVVTATDAAGNTSAEVIREVQSIYTGPLGPTVSTPKSPTNQNPITLTVSAGGGLTVRITGGANVVQFTATGGDQVVSVDLNPNQTNTLQVVAIDAAGKQSPPTTRVVVHDSIAPNPPTVNDPVSPTDSPFAPLVVTAEAGTTISVVGGAAPVTATATGSTQDVAVPLVANATNVLSITATDAAGNTSSAVTKHVVRTPARSQIRGRVAVASVAGVSVSATPGGATASLSADGSFVLANLNPDQLYTLQVNGVNGITYYHAAGATGNVSTSSSSATPVKPGPNGAYVEMSVLPLPSITSISGGGDNSQDRTITINGANLNGTTDVFLVSGTQSMRLSQYGVVSATSVTATIEAGFPVGSYKVQVRTSAGLSSLSSGSVTVSAPPTPIPLAVVSTLSQVAVPQGTSPTIVLMGTNFGDASAVTLNPGGISLAPANVSSTSLEVTVPNTLAPGRYTFRVTNGAGIGPSSPEIEVVQAVSAAAISTPQVVTAPVSLAGATAIPANLTLTNEGVDRAGTSAKVSVVLPQGLTLTKESGGAPSEILPPRTVPAPSDAPADAVAISVGSPTSRIVLNMPIVLQVEVVGGETTPIVYFYDPDTQQYVLGGIDGVQDGTTYHPGGVVLSRTPLASGQFRYVMGVLLDHLSTYVSSSESPAPKVTSLSPGTVTAGGPDFTLTVVGSNFVSSSQIYWNGQARTTGIASGTMLTATIPASDISTPGNVTITVVNPAPGGGTSDPLTLIVTPKATGEFKLYLPMLPMGNATGW